MQLSRKNSHFLASVLKRRITGEPLSYILNKIEFMGLDFKVSKDVLIPRQETELLVEAVLDIAGSWEDGVGSKTILDLGTGSGCIAVSLAKFLKNVSIYATDISKKALEIAKDNARRNSVSDTITFLASDLFSHPKIKNMKFDIIISNPPYIARKDFIKLSAEVQCEPRLALDGGEDGLIFYRRILQEAPVYLRRRGILIMEMGFKQSLGIQALITDSKYLEILKIIKDYGNIDRVIIIKKK
jgi:release factor glutamine methyltransferase